LARTDITKVNFFFPAAFVALGGMVYVLVTLSWIQGVAGYWAEGRMITSGATVKLFVPVMTAAACALVVWLYVKRPDLSVGQSGGGGSTRYGSTSSSYGAYGYSSQTTTQTPYGQTRGYSSGSSGSSAQTIVLIAIVGLMAICLISVGADFASFLIASSATSTISYFLAHFFDKRPSVRAAIVGVWFVGYVILWTIGGSRAISLPVFISFWVVFGGLAGYFLSDMIRAENIADKRNADKSDERPKSNDPQPKNKGPAGAAVHDINYRRRHTSAKYSEFGRLPQDTSNILAHLVRRTTGPISSALPVDACLDMTNDTVSIVLDCLILDWRVNNNLNGVDDTDVQDIRTFITFACTFAGPAYNGVDRAAYKAVLKSLMSDWLTNWNSDGVSGPPQG
jgi:hypothetical protein